MRLATTTTHKQISIFCYKRSHTLHAYGISAFEEKSLFTDKHLCVHYLQNILSASLLYTQQAHTSLYYCLEL